MTENVKMWKKYVLEIFLWVIILQNEMFYQFAKELK